MEIFKGKSVLVRCVGFAYVGRLIDVGPFDLVLEECAWVADTRRFHSFLADGPSAEAEIEPYPDGRVCISRTLVQDCSEWRHALPREAQ